MWKWLSRILIWPLALIGALLASSFFLIQQEPVQQYVAQRVLKILNRKLAGDIQVESIAIKLHGSVSVRGFELSDPDGHKILTAERVNAWVVPWDILRGRIHVLKADLTNVRGNFIMESGENNFARAFKAETAPKESSATPLWVRLDRLNIDFDTLTFKLDSSFQHLFTNHNFKGDVFITDSVITFDAVVSKQDAFSVTGNGVVRPYSDTLLAGDAKFNGTSQYVQSEWAPEFPDLGQLDLTARADIQKRDLTSLFDIRAEKVGRAKGDIEIEDYNGEPRVSVGAAFDSLDFSIWIGDSIPHSLSGRAALTKSKSPDWSHDWIGRVQLDSSFYGDVDITADVETELYADAVAIAGEIRTNAGAFKLRVRADGLSPDSVSVYGHAALSSADLHVFVPQIPDSLSPLSGEVEFSFDRFPGQDLKAEAALKLGAVALGKHRLDSLAFHAIVNGTEFILDSTRMRLGTASALLFARGDYTKSISAELHATLPRIEEFRELIAPYFPQADSLSGDIETRLTAFLTFDHDTLRDISAAGILEGERLALGNIIAHNLTVTLDTLVVSTEHIRAKAECDSVIVAQEVLKPVSLSLDGSWFTPSFTVSVAARGDTLSVSATGAASYRTTPYSFELEDLSVGLYGTAWHNDFPVIFSFDSLHYEIEALVMRSEFGVLRASGFLENPGQQDLVVEFSGLRTGALAPILRRELPDGALNLRLQFTGTDRAIIGNLDARLDDVTYKNSLLADQVTLNASLDKDGLLAANAVYTWLSDTAMTISANLPATLSMKDGLFVSEGEQLAGTLSMDSLQLSQFSPWFSAGTLLEGFLSANLSLSGSALNPNWNGEVHLTDGLYRDTRYGVAYKWIVMDADLRRDSLVIHSLRATSRGTMTGTGFARLGVPWPEELDLNLTFDRFEAVSSRLQKARLDGNISLSGPFDSLNAQGRLTIQEGMYRLTQSATKTIEPVNLDSVLAVLRGDSLEEGFNTDAFYESMSHDLAINIPGNFWIRGSGLNTELSGDLRLEKEHYQEPTANGEIAIRNGTVKFYGQELRISDNSTLRFDGPADSPELNISALYTGVERERGYEITVKLTGTPDNSLAEFSGRYDDGTVMAEDEAIQKLIPFARTGDGSGFNAEQSVVDAASGQVSDIVSKASGLDVFEFRPGPGGLSDLSSGQLELGTYVTDRIFVRVFQPIEDPRSGQKVSIDYRLLDWMKLTAEQESKSQSSTSSSFTVYLQFEWR